MLIPILILSGIFIAIAFLVTRNNAAMILSGYNALPSKDQKQVDLDGLLIFFKKFHLFLGVSTALIGTLLHFFTHPHWLGFFMMVYPFSAYLFFILKSRVFYAHSTKKQKLITYFVILLLAGLVVYSLLDFFFLSR